MAFIMQFLYNNAPVIFVLFQYLKGNKTQKVLWLKSIGIEERIMGKIVKNFKK